MFLAPNRDHDFPGKSPPQALDPNQTLIVLVRRGDPYHKVAIVELVDRPDRFVLLVDLIRRGSYSEVWKGKAIDRLRPGAFCSAPHRLPQSA